MFSLYAQKMVAQRKPKQHVKGAKKNYAGFISRIITGREDVR